jgi:hypothetical protein
MVVTVVVGAEGGATTAAAGGAAGAVVDAGATANDRNCPLDAAVATRGDAPWKPTVAARGAHAPAVNPTATASADAPARHRARRIVPTPGTQLSPRPYGRVDWCKRSEDAQREADLRGAAVGTRV